MFNRVLVGVDGRSGGRDAIALARQLGAPSGTIVLANVYRESGMGYALPVAAEDRSHAQRLLTDQRHALGVKADTVVRLDGSPARGLHVLAETEHADLLVVGSSHRGALGRVLLGDDACAALNGAPCAVAVAPRGYALGGGEWRVIGVGDDGSAESKLARDAARVLADRHHARVRLRSVVSLQSVATVEDAPEDWTYSTDRLMDRERERLAHVEGMTGEVVYGDAAERLARLAGEVQLLVVGSRGYGPLGRLINGSTSTHLARHCPCPLLVMPRGVVSTAAPEPAGPSPGLPVPAGRAS